MHLKIITNEKIVFDEDVDEVYTKTTDGEIGILKNHVPVMAALDIGVTKAVKNNEPKYWQAYPDFYSSALDIVMDAKYKHAKEVKDIARDDRMQIISYMHILGLKKGVFLYPSESYEEPKYSKLHLYHKENTDEYVYQYCFKIPQGEINGMQDFIDKITVSENEFIEYWKSVLKNNNETVKC